MDLQRKGAKTQRCCLCAFASLRLCVKFSLGMSIQPQTFAFSERYLANRRRFIYLLAAPMVILIVFEMLIMTRFEVSPGLVIFTMLIFVIIILETRYTHGQWRKMRLHFGPNGLVRETGRVQQTVTWDSITKV